MRKTQDRALHYGRTKHKPGLGIRCKVCRREEDRQAVAKHPLGGIAIGSRVEGCEYVNYEKVFADAWEEEQKKDPSMPLVQRLMVVYPKNGPKSFLGLDMGRMAFWLTPRERVIVASIVQWLGTNVGMCFLQETLRKCGLLVVQDETKTDRYAMLKDDVRAAEQRAKDARKDADDFKHAYTTLLAERDNLVVEVARVVGVPVGQCATGAAAVQQVERLAQELAEARAVLDRLNMNPQPVGGTAAMARFVGIGEED